MINLLSMQSIEGANYTTWDKFEFWLSVQTEYQLDIETNVTKHWCTKKIQTIQFGDVEGGTQYVLEWACLTDEQKLVIKRSLEDWNVCKLIHRASFEYIVLRFHGMEVHNVFCTLIAEKVLQGGIENADYSLEDLALKYCSVTLDKSLQTAFGDGILTLPKVEYAATDCMYLGIIRRKQLELMLCWQTDIVTDPLAVLDLEMKSVLAFSDCTYYGVGIDQEKWLENVKVAKPVVNAAHKNLLAWLDNDQTLRAQAIKLGYLLEEEQLVYNLNSHKQKILLLQQVFPDIVGATKVILKAYIRDKGPSLSEEQLDILVSLSSGDSSPFERYLYKYHRDFLVQNEFILEAGSVQLNWNSISQVLALVQAVEPKLKSLAEKDVAKCSHPIFLDLSEYKESLLLLSTFGEKFLLNLEPDGKIRTNYNQIVSTGRVSSSNPNMQQIPCKENYLGMKPWLEANPGKKPKDFVTRYRNAFIWDTGFTFVDSDYTGQELCCIADMAKDDVWFTAIKNGEDLHSVTGSMVFGSKWKEGTEEGCVFEKHKQKCNCKKHKTYRTATKTVNFGLAFGMSEFKLAATIRVSVKEAKALIEDYFKAFPKIKQLLEFLGQFGVKKGYIHTKGPYFRRRQFPEWYYYTSFIENHLSGVEYNKALGSIERKSKNLPIQGLAANIMKLAMWYAYKWIRDNGYVDRINCILNVHDQLTTVCEDELVEMWTKQLDTLMVDAGKVILKSGILTADTQATGKCWSK